MSLKNRLSQTPWRLCHELDYRGPKALAAVCHGACPGPPVDEKWAETFIVELRLIGVQGVRIGAALSEVESHCSESGESAQRAFGAPVDYARSLQLPVDSVHSPAGMVRSLVPIMGQLLGMLMLNWSFGAWLDSQSLDITTGHLLIASIALLVMVATVRLAVAVPVAAPVPATTYIFSCVGAVQQDPHDGDHQPPHPEETRREEQRHRDERRQRHDRVALVLQEPQGATRGPAPVDTCAGPVLGRSMKRAPRSARVTAALALVTRCSCPGSSRPACQCSSSSTIASSRPAVPTRLLSPLPSSDPVGPRFSSLMTPILSAVKRRCLVDGRLKHEGRPKADGVA